MSATNAVAWGVSVGALDLEARPWRPTTPLRTAAATSASLRPSSDALVMMWSSMSVMFDT